MNALSSSVEKNTNNITSLSTTVGGLQSEINGIDKTPRKTYDVVYNDTENPEVGENVFALYEITNEDQAGEERKLKTKFTIVGGSGGGTTSTLKIEYITTSPLIVTVNDKVIIKYRFSGQDSSGDQVSDGIATWKIGKQIISTGTAISGENTFDATNYIGVGTQKLTLSITDDAGSLVTKTWTVQKIDVRLESSFNDKLTYNMGQVSFDYTPYGAISKDIHFKLDGVELGKVTTSSSGIPMAYSIPAQTHGAHLLEAYITAEINGSTVDKSIVTGKVFVPVMREKLLAQYNEAWPDLEITYNTLVQQFTVTFKNDNGDILDIQYVDKGTKAVDPLTRVDNPIAIPTKESTVSTDYTFAGWDKALVDAFDDQIITATYSETTRSYTVKYVSKGKVMQETTALYGSNVLYIGDIPTYTSEESAYKYYLFDGWDQGGYVNGDKTINAVYDSCEYKEGYFANKELADMRPVEIYMMTRLASISVITLSDYVAAKDALTVKLGNDFTYSDIEEKVLISEETVFTGSNYVDTGINLLSEDRDFVLAIDCKIDAGNSTNAVLAQCFSGLNTSGFKLLYNNGVNLAWGSASSSPFSADSREMLVLRHIKGENGLYVYSSSTTSDRSYYGELSGIHSMDHNVSLVFGCSKLEDGSYEQYGKGTVYWSKIWYTDLGDDVCAKIAYWPHEEIEFEACCEQNGSLKRYYLSDNSGARSSMTFISSKTLERAAIMDPEYSNEGGWAKFALNKYLNERVYNALPDKWKQLIKQVKIKSSIGKQSLSVSSSDCYIFVPSIAELVPSMTQEPYASEGTIISHFSSNTARICYNPNGAAVQYWTRSPSLGWDNYVFRITTSGGYQGITQTSAVDVYPRIMISI